MLFADNVVRLVLLLNRSSHSIVLPSPGLYDFQFELNEEFNESNWNLMWVRESLLYEEKVLASRSRCPDGL